MGQLYITHPYFYTSGRAGMPFEG